MAKTQEKKSELQTPAEDIIVENRIDEFAIGQFRAMGHTGRLPDSVVELYKVFKLQKDKQSPGRLSPEGFAFVDVLSGIVDGRIVLASAATAKKKAGPKDN